MAWTVASGVSLEPAGSSSRNPPTFASDGPPASPAYQFWRGSHVVSSASLLGTIVVWWMTAIALDR